MYKVTLFAEHLHGDPTTETYYEKPVLCWTVVISYILRDGHINFVKLVSQLSNSYYLISQGTIVGVLSFPLRIPLSYSMHIYSRTRIVQCRMKTVCSFQFYWLMQFTLHCSANDVLLFVVTVESKHWSAAWISAFLWSSLWEPLFWTAVDGVQC